MRHSYRPDTPTATTLYTQVLDHLGLVMRMFEERSTEVIDRTTQQDPEMRMVTAGHAVKAMVLNGLGFSSTNKLYLVPHFSRISPSRASLLQAFRRAISMTPSGAPSIPSTTLG